MKAKFKSKLRRAKTLERQERPYKDRIITNLFLIKASKRNLKKMLRLIHKLIQIYGKRKINYTTIVKCKCLKSKTKSSIRLRV